VATHDSRLFEKVQGRIIELNRGRVESKHNI
jgi:ABC-type ATPase involved in cell division